MPARQAAVLRFIGTRVNLSVVIRARTASTPVARNAGGCAADALRSLMVALHGLGLKYVFVNHRTVWH